LAAYVGVGHAIGCNSGTDALVLALRAAGVGHDDFVAVPAFTFSATAAAVELVDAEIVFCDIREEDFGIDASQLDKWKLNGVKAVIGVNMFGIPCDWDGIRKATEGQGVVLIEDAAQSMGAMYKGARSGSLADIGCTSFYPSKPLSGIGDGGMVFTNDPIMAQDIRSISNHGRAIGLNKPYSAIRVGMNSRLDSIQAAVLLERFKDFEIHELPYRNRQASDYFYELEKCPSIYGQMGYKMPWSWYPLLYPNREERDEAFLEYGRGDLKWGEHGGARVIYPEPLHLMPAFKHYGHKRGDFPVSESVCDRILAFPINHHWEENQCLRFLMSSATSAATASR